MKHWQLLIGLCAALVLAACTTTSSIGGAVRLDPQASWVLLPLTNHTDTPQAALAAEAIVDHQLRRRGIQNLVRYPARLSRDSLFEPSERKLLDEAQQWAREQGARYGVQGAVEEWRYKVGIDGEPAVGITLQVVDLADGNKVLWSASGAKSGWSRVALSQVANQLLAEVLAELPTPAAP